MRMMMKNFELLFLVVLLLCGLAVGCTPEERADLLNQFKKEADGGSDSGSQSGSDGGSSTQDDTPEYPVNTLSGSFALDDGTGLTTLYYSFLDGVLYKYAVTSPVVLAEGYLWHVSGEDFTLLETDTFRIVDGVIYCKGMPLGDVQITNKKMTLAGQDYARISGFKPQRYSVITIEGGLDRTCDYRAQTISIPVSLKRIPSGQLKATCDATWVRSGGWEGDVLTLSIDEFNYRGNNYSSSRTATITLTYPEAEDVIITLRQNYAYAQIEFVSSGASRTVENSGGTFSFDVSIANPRNYASLSASSSEAWITDVSVNGNTISYKVAENHTGSNRAGSILLAYTYYVYAPIGYVGYNEEVREEFIICQLAFPIDPTAANCYIVSSPGTYSFKAVYGNTTTPIGGVATPEVLWESFGTDVAPEKGDIIQSVSYQAGSGSTPGIITYSTPSVLKNGNAVIAAKDASGNILWSWHIWVCKDYDPVATGQEYYNNAGVMMDRNLGATSATPGDVGALGLLYQWGRKDPFLGGNGISSNVKAASTFSWPSPVSSDSNTGTIAYAVKNPTTFITYNSSNYDWYYTSATDNTRWQSTKTIYDPCPPGWRVPAGGSSGVWSKAVGSSNDFSGYPYDSTNKGMNFSGKFGSADTIWYPAAGFLDYDDGSLDDVGSYGYWWSCTPTGGNAYYLYLNRDGLVFPSDINYRARGHSVRCLQE